MWDGGLLAHFVCICGLFWVGVVLVGGWFQVGRMTLLFFFLLFFSTRRWLFCLFNDIRAYEGKGFIYAENMNRILAVLCFFNGYKCQIGDSGYWGISAPTLKIPLSIMIGDQSEFLGLHDLILGNRIKSMRLGA